MAGNKLILSGNKIVLAGNKLRVGGAGEDCCCDPDTDPYLAYTWEWDCETDAWVLTGVTSGCAETLPTDDTEGCEVIKYVSIGEDCAGVSFSYGGSTITRTPAEIAAEPNYYALWQPAAPTTDAHDACCAPCTCPTTPSAVSLDIVGGTATIIDYDGTHDFRWNAQTDLTLTRYPEDCYWYGTGYGWEDFNGGGEVYKAIPFYITLNTTLCQWELYIVIGTPGATPDSLLGTKISGATPAGTYTDGSVVS